MNHPKVLHSYTQLSRIKSCIKGAPQTHFLFIFTVCCRILSSSARRTAVQSNRSTSPKRPLPPFTRLYYLAVRPPLSGHSHSCTSLARLRHNHHNQHDKYKSSKSLSNFFCLSTPNTSPADSLQNGSQGPGFGKLTR